MNKEELIEVLRQFDEKRVEELPEKTRKIFYAIMKIADERDKLKNIRKEAIECIETDSIEINTKEYGNLTVINSDDLLNILKKGDNNE